MSQPPTSTWSRVFSAGVVPNTGSAARDHLAGERTVLAWLRTSMVLATIGITLAQLLRLPSTAFGTSSVPVTTASSSSISKRNEMSANVTAALEALVASDPGLEPLVHLLAAQQAQLDSHRLATLSSGAAESPYAHLAAPLGGTFLMLSLVFLLLGIQRYYAVQLALLREPSQFPPSRRSIGFVTFSIGALVVACFAAVIASR